MHPRYESWSKSRRFDAAISKVLDDEWTQKEAAELYGVSRQHLNLRVKRARLARAEEVEAARVSEAERLGRISTLSGERRRVPQNIKDFVETIL